MKTMANKYYNVDKSPYHTNCYFIHASEEVHKCFLEAPKNNPFSYQMVIIGLFGLEPSDFFKYIQVKDIDSMFSISSQGKSAKDKLDELIYNHGYSVENITINSVPIYYLQPNTRIYLYDNKTNLSGDYIISKMTIPLGYNGTMQITATKAAENII